MAGYKPYLTSDDLIASIKRRAAIPVSQVTFSNQDLLDFANEEMQMGILPSVLQLHEEFFLTMEDVPLQSNVNKYEIPYRAVGSKLRDIVFEDTNGNLYEMARISPDERVHYQFMDGSFNQAYRFYIENNAVVPVPGVGDNVSGSFVMAYYMRPNQLVLNSRAAIITGTSVSGLNTILQLSSAPSNIVDGSVVDFLQTAPGHRTLKYDYTLTPGTVNQVNKTFTIPTADLPTSLSVGDYICLAQEAIIPQIPAELHPVLAQRAAARCLEALGDTSGLQNANLKLAEMEMKLTNIIDNRAESSPIKVVNFHSPLRYGKFRRIGYNRY